ncbi:MAG: response regulator [Novosphingobium sp.]|jgi:two-component system nitrate/nitrite response regulator NarL|nr:response regulator transcription factor [Novosphingobium sp.]
MRILIVDDHAFLRAGVRAALTTAGHTICGEASNGEDALAQFVASRPELVLMDIRMAGMDGVATIDALRAKDPLARIIVLTAELGDNALVALIRQKVDGIVFKHGRETELFEAIAEVAAGRRYIDSGLMEKAFELVSRGEGAGYEALATLTSREKAIVELAATGLRNREIGQRLDMTEGTVKVYLHNVYRKLGIAGRVELAVMIQNRKSKAA